MLLIVTDHELQRVAIGRFLADERLPVISVEVWPRSVRRDGNPQAICLDENLVEHRRELCPQALHRARLLKAKLEHSRAILIATRSSDEGHVHARDIAQCLEGVAVPIFRIELQGLSHSALMKSFARESWSQNFDVLAHKGEARRIIYHAINRAFVAGGLVAGPLSTHILSSIQQDPLPVKMLEWSNHDLGRASAMLPVHLLGSGYRLINDEFSRADYVDSRQQTERCATPWLYWELVCHGAVRLGRSVFQVAAALEQAWHEGKISDPSSISSYIDQATLITLADLADHNRCEFDAKLLLEKRYRIAPGLPLQPYLSLGLSTSSQSDTEAITLLLARNWIEAGQEAQVTRGRIWEFELVRVDDAPRNNWLPRAPANALVPIARDLSLALRMAFLQIPVFSNGLALIGRFMDSGVISDEGKLSGRGQQVLTESKNSGLVGTFVEIERSLNCANLDNAPSETAWQVLRDTGLLQPVLNRIAEPHRRPQFTPESPIRSWLNNPRVIVTAAT